MVPSSNFYEILDEILFQNQTETAETGEPRKFLMVIYNLQFTIYNLLRIHNEEDETKEQMFVIVSILMRPVVRFIRPQIQSPFMKFN